MNENNKNSRVAPASSQILVLLLGFAGFALWLVAAHKLQPGAASWFSTSARGFAGRNAAAAFVYTTLEESKRRFCEWEADSG